MRIQRSLISVDVARERSEHLRRLTVVPDYRQQRPCASCDTPCGCTRRSTLCACSCNPWCPQAAQKLTSDPIRYPIEPGVLPLVFELNASQVMQPCWSCEGHEDAARRIVRPPGVWFYATAGLYPQLLAGHVADLKFKRRLTANWRVVLLPRSEDPLLTTFALEPEGYADLKLERLQADLAVIAEDLSRLLRRQAEHALAELPETPR